MDTSKLRSIRVNSNKCDNNLEIFHSENIVAPYISNCLKLSETSYENYSSLTSLIIPETISYIDPNAFKKSNIEMFVRFDEETFKEKIDNGWDDGINVNRSFSEEIIVFDSICDTEIKNESTQKKLFES